MDEWESQLIKAIEQHVLASDSRVVVIDNISYLISEADKGKSALPLMRRLNDLKKQHGLSILVLAHTPKLYFVRALIIDNLAGSKILANFADSIFGIGKSSQKSNLRYLKQLKARSTELVYDTENVAVFRFEKPNNFLGFEFVGSSRECDHLAKQNKEDKESIIESAKLLASQGKSQREIANEINISLGSVNKYLNQ